MAASPSRSRAPSTVWALPPARASRPSCRLPATTLEEQPESKFTLVYGNRRMSSVMFNEALQDLKDRYPDA